MKYFHDQKTPLENFEDVAKFCPSLSTIFLDTPEKDVLGKLSNFKHTKKLKFNKIEFNLLLETLKMMNNQITWIDLVSCSGNLDIGTLSQLCPNLRTLEIYYSRNVSSKSPVKLINLRRIVIYSTDLFGDAANDILENSPNIEHITIDSATTLDYTKLLKMLNKDCLKEVDEQAIMSAPCLDLLGDLRAGMRPLHN